MFLKHTPIIIVICGIFISKTCAIKTYNVAFLGSSNIPRFLQMFNQHLQFSRCPNNSYAINVIPFNKTSPYQTPIGLNTLTNIQLTMGSKTFYGPEFYGFLQKPNTLKFSKTIYYDFSIDISLRFQIMLSALTSALSNDPNKTAMIIIPADLVNSLQPWRVFNPMQYFGSFNGSIKVIPYYNISTAYTVANILQTTTIKNIAVDLSFNDTANLIAACDSRRLLNWKYRWLVFYSGFATMYNPSLYNIYFSQNFTTYDYCSTCISTLNGTINLQGEIEMILSDSAYTMVRLLDYDSCNALVTEDASLSTGIVTFNSSGAFRKQWSVLIYKYNNGFNVVGRLTSGTDGTVTIRQPPVPLYQLTFSNILTSMRAVPFRVAALVESPMVNPPGSSAAGHSIDMINQILLNLQVQPLITYYYMTTGILNNTQLTGILNLAQTAQADIVVGSITYFKNYLPYIDMTTNIMPYKFAILYQKNATSNYQNIFQFILVFDYSVWILIIVSTLVYSLVLFLVNRISPNRANFSLMDSFFFFMGSLIQGVTTALPDKPSGRILVVFWWIFNLIVLLAYVAVYGAIRTNVRLQPPITSLEDVSKQTNYNTCTVSESSVVQYLMTSPYQYTQEIYSSLQGGLSGQFTSNLTVALSLVQQGNFAFIYHDTILNLQMNKDGMQLTNGFGQYFYSYALPKDSDFTNIINVAINNLTSTYKTSLINTYFPNVPSRKSIPQDWLGQILTALQFLPAGPDTYSLDISQTAGIFVIMIFGIIISIFTAVIEFLVDHCRKPKVA